jgi:hypothetical protein
VSLLYVLEDGLLRFTHRQLCRWLLLSLDRLPTHELQSRQDPVLDHKQLEARVRECYAVVKKESPR